MEGMLDKSGRKKERSTHRDEETCELTHADGIHAADVKEGETEHPKYREDSSALWNTNNPGLRNRAEKNLKRAETTKTKKINKCSPLNKAEVPSAHLEHVLESHVLSGVEFEYEHVVDVKARP